MSVDPRFIASMLTSDPSEIRTPGILSEADMPPPSPPAMVRGIEKQNASAVFKEALADAVKRFPGDMAKAIRYVTSYQTDNLDNPAEFVKLLENLATKNNVNLSDLKDTSAYRGARGRAASAPSNSQAAKPDGDQVAENAVDPRAIASMLTEDPSVFTEMAFNEPDHLPYHGSRLNDPNASYLSEKGDCRKDFKVGNAIVTVHIWYTDTGRGVTVKDWECEDCSLPRGPECDMAMQKVEDAINSGKVDLEDICEQYIESEAGMQHKPSAPYLLESKRRSVVTEMAYNDPDSIYEDKKHRCYKTFKVGDATVEVCIWFIDSRKGVTVIDWEISDCSLPRESMRCNLAMQKVEEAIGSGKINIEEVCEDHCSKCAGDC